MKISFISFIFFLAHMAGLAGPPNSASHVIRIVIHRRQVFQVEAVRDLPSGQITHESLSENNATFRFNWESTLRNKRVTISSRGAEADGRLIIAGKKEVVLSESHLDISNNLQEFERQCLMQYIPRTRENQPARLVCTLTDG